MAALQRLRNAKKRLQEVNTTVIKPPDPKRAKLEKERKIISDLLDGIFDGLNSTPPKKENHCDDVPSPVIFPQSNMSDRLYESIISWIKTVISDKSDTTISGIGYHGGYTTWIEVSSSRGVIWKGPSAITPKLLENGIDTKSEAIYSEYASWLVHFMMYLIPYIPLPPGQRELEPTQQFGFFFIESTNHCHSLSLPRELQDRLRPNPETWYTQSEKALYISTADLIDVMGISPVASTQM